MRFILLSLLVLTAMLNADEWTRVEQKFLEVSNHKQVYLNEKIKVIEVSDCRELGKLLAYRFLEWVQSNPDGVIALPTGKTPEAFINYMKYLKTNWNTESVQEEIAKFGISKTFPEMKNLKFVQLDEFYAIDPSHANSFTKYVKEHYLDAFGIEQALLMDINTKELSIPYPEAKFESTSNECVEALKKIDKFAEVYEQQIRKWGGIGFFVGGIGIDGHVAFNQPGSEEFSRTRLVKLGYIPAAQSAISLGGIEYTRDRFALTIGLDTILFNPDAVIILMVAGEGKASITSKVIEGEITMDVPASFMQKHPGSRCYITRGAASKLQDRNVEDAAVLPLTKSLMDEIFISIALKNKKSILNLSEDEVLEDLRAKAILNRTQRKISDLKEEVVRRIKQKFSYKLPNRKSILHTGPHHDDVMLSYFGLLPYLLEKNMNKFVYLTSGFNAVTDQFMKDRLSIIFEQKLSENSYFNSTYEDLLERMIAVSEEPENLKIAESILLARHIGDFHNIEDFKIIQKQARELLEIYFAEKKPGEKDSKEIQILKGAMRESEEDRHMLMHCVPLQNVVHMRSNFYTGDYFNPLPSIEKDAIPLLDIFNSFEPDIVTVTLDPEGTGPDTHYKVLQVVNQALKMWDSNPKVWGYRNVWYHFPLSETTKICPISESQLQELHHCFMSCYTTQKEASFPALEYDGPFSEYAIITQREQLAELKMLLGEEFFDSHPDSRFQNAAGLLFLKEMTKQELAEHVAEL
jgi:glucosamine-6-phosphate deaminase